MWYNLVQFFVICSLYMAQIKKICAYIDNNKVHGFIDHNDSVDNNEKMIEEEKKTNISQ